MELVWLLGVVLFGAWLHRNRERERQAAERRRHSRKETGDRQEQRVVNAPEAQAVKSSISKTKTAAIRTGLTTKLSASTKTYQSNARSEVRRHDIPSESYSNHEENQFSTLKSPTGDELDEDDLVLIETWGGELDETADHEIQPEQQALEAEARSQKTSAPSAAIDPSLADNSGQLETSLEPSVPKTSGAAYSAHEAPPPITQEADGFDASGESQRTHNGPPKGETVGSKEHDDPGVPVSGLPTGRSAETAAYKLDEEAKKDAVSSMLDDMRGELEGGRDRVPDVETEDWSFDPESMEPGVDQATESHPEPGDSEFDFEEIEEPNTGGDVVTTDGTVSRRDRAEQMAIAVGNKFNWDREGIELLTEVFKAYGWGPAKDAIDRLLIAGLTPSELDVAYRLRRLWAETESFWVKFYFRSGRTTDGRPIYSTLSWPTALRLIRVHSGEPTFDEIELLLWELLYDWQGSSRFQRTFTSFASFLNAWLDESERRGFAESPALFWPKLWNPENGDYDP